MKTGIGFKIGVVTATILLAIHAECFGAWRWLGWREVPGNGFTSKPISAVWFKAERLLYMFHTGENNRIYYQATFKGYMSGWIEVPGGGLTDADVSATIWTNDTDPVADDSLYLFARGTDGVIYVNTKPANGAWSGWFSFVSHPAVAPGSGPVAQTATNCIFPSDVLNVFFSDIYGVDWHLQYCPLVGRWTILPVIPSIVKIGRFGGDGLYGVYAAAIDLQVYRASTVAVFSECDPVHSWRVIPGLLTNVPPSGVGWNYPDCGGGSILTFCKQLGSNRIFYEGSYTDQPSWSEVQPPGATTDVSPGSAVVPLAAVDVVVVLVKGINDHRIYWNIAKRRRR